MDNFKFFVYLAVMAGVTYLVRMIPLVLVKKKIKNKFILSFLHYIPYSVLSVMTIPGIFYSTSNRISAFFGFLAAIILAQKEKSLLTVAAFSCATVLIAEVIMKLI